MLRLAVADWRSEHQLTGLRLSPIKNAPRAAKIEGFESTISSFVLDRARLLLAPHRPTDAGCMKWFAARVSPHDDFSESCSYVERARCLATRVG